MIIALGEALLDVIIAGPDQVRIRPGGAMLNASVSIGRSHVKVALITELGNDEGASMVLRFLKSNQVETSSITQYDSIKSTLALAWLDEQKKPSYTFYKSYPDERRLKQKHAFKTGDFLVFGSLYALDKGIRSSIVSNVNAASAANALVYYDPNIRHSQHLQHKGNMAALEWNLEHADIIKGSDEDFKAIYGISDREEVVDKIRNINPHALFVYTIGAEGVWAHMGSNNIHLPAKPITIKSTVGAGDAFNAGLLVSLARQKQTKASIRQLTLAELTHHLESGLDFAAQVCSSFDNYVAE